MTDRRDGIIFRASSDFRLDAPQARRTELERGVFRPPRGVPGRLDDHPGHPSRQELGRRHLQPNGRESQWQRKGGPGPHSPRHFARM